MKKDAKNPQVGILLGSESDREVADAACGILVKLGISHEVLVASAHRDPDKVRDYSREAEERGIQVLIGIAGMSAALPGVMSSHTQLPVIGVPVPAGPLSGFDAILSMVQLPSGVPVGTVTLGNSGGRNAALLAARIVAGRDGAIRKKLRSFRLKKGSPRKKKA
jgi:phosphoribosylaminoimidazole carboxylase PurE protein